jgi:ribose transport system permease protein
MTAATTPVPNIRADQTRQPARVPWRLLLPLLLLAALFLAFISIHPRGMAVASVTPWANQAVSLAFVAVGQFFVVVTRGLDLSIGAILALSNALASIVVNGSPVQIVGGIGLVLAVGAVCGAFNGAAVIFGRIEPIVATLATGALYSGLALVLRPTPGGEVAESMSDLFTYESFSVIPTSLILLFATVFLVWGPLSRTVMGRSLYAIGSNENAAFMSGLSPRKSRMLAHTLAGFFAACGGLFLTFQTLSGDASAGFSYTLNSIAAVVVGGASLAGGLGTVLGVIAGAYILRTISSIMIFTGLPPMAQPLFEGLVLLTAVSVGAIELIRARNKLKVMR